MAADEYSQPTDREDNQQSIHDDETRIIDTTELQQERTLQNHCDKTQESQQRDALPTQIEQYAIVREVGEGAFGIVYEAIRNEPRQTVAIKVIKPGMDTRAVIRRFQEERNTLARMTHDSIARIFDAGTTDRGLPYFVMEFVDGIPITTYCDEHELTNNDRIKLFMQVCDAIQHAHTKGLIHRDIKPSNVLVTEKDGKPQVKVIDFGLAKVNDRNQTYDSLLDDRGRMVGTPAYMSPEQAEMGDHDIDFRADVYALGVLLYELLSGLRPIDDAVFRASPISEIRRLKLEIEPPKPSARLSTIDTKASRKRAEELDCESHVDTIARQRQTLPGNLRRQLHRDLDWITMKAMDIERNRRYQSPRELEQDLERFLANDPVEARPPSRIYRMSKFMRKHRAGVAAATVMVMLLLAGVLVSTLFAVIANSQRMDAELATLEADTARDAARTAKDQAQEEANVANASLSFLVDMLASANPEERPGARDDITLRKLLDEASVELDSDPPDSQRTEAMLRYAIGESYRGVGQIDEAQRHLQRAVDVWRTTHDDIWLADALFSLGISYRFSDVDKAIELLNESSEIRQRLLGPDHEDTLAAVADANKYEDFKRGLGANDAFGETMLTMMAQLDTKKRSPEEIRNFLEWSILEVDRFWKAGNKEAAYGVIDASVVDINLNNSFVKNRLALAFAGLANNLRDRNRNPGTAEALYRYGLKFGRENMPKDHPDVLRVQYLLGYFLARQDRPEDALEPLRESYEARKRVLDSTHPELLFSLNELADVEARLGMIEQATEHFREIITLTRGRSKFSDYTLYAALNAANYRAEQYRKTASMNGEDRDDDEIDVYINEAQEFINIAREEIAEYDHASTWVYNDLGVAASHLGDVDGAVEWFEDGYEKAVALDDMKANTVKQICYNASGLLNAHYRHAEAATWYERWYRWEVSIKGKDSDAAHQVAGDVQRSYEAAGNEEEAAIWQAKIQSD